MRRLIFGFIVTAIVSAFMLTPVLAADTCEPTNQDPSSGQWNLDKFKSDPACLSDPIQARGYLGQVISTVITLTLIAGAVAALGMFVLGAYQYMLARGDAAKASQARKTIIYAVVGLVIMGMVYVLILFYGAILPPKDA